MHLSHKPPKTNTFWLSDNGYNGNRNLQIILSPVGQLPSKMLIINFLFHSTFCWLGLPEYSGVSTTLLSQQREPKHQLEIHFFHHIHFTLSRSLLATCLLAFFLVTVHVAYLPGGA